MFRYLINQWRFRTFTIALIIFGFFIASVVLSIGISVSVENYRYINDRNSGDTREQLIINLYFQDEPRVDSSLIKDYSQYGELQIISPLKKTILDDYKQEFQIIPVLFEKEANWHIPIIHGRYFNRDDFHNTSKEIVIGKEISESLGLKVNDSLMVDGEKFKIVGISGRVNRGTQWDDAIYVVFNDYKDKMEDFFGEDKYMTILLKEGKKDFINDSKTLIAKAESKGIMLTFEEPKDTVSFESFTNSIVITIILSGSVFIIAIVNIINLMIYWVMDRAKEFGILKSIGATNKYITKWITIEVMIMIFVSSIVAMLTQGLAQILLKDFLIENEIYFSITWINLLVSIIVATVFGTFSAIIPCRTAVNINLIELVNRE